MRALNQIADELSRVNRTAKEWEGALNETSRKSAYEVMNPAHWVLRLYIAGQTSKSLAAISNLYRLCELHLAGQFHIEVIDLLETPQLAQGDQIIAIPTLVRKRPQPVRKIMGDLSDTAQALAGLERHLTKV